MPDETAHSFWEDPDIQKAATGGEFVKFVNIGDCVSGKIRKLNKRDFDGRTAVEVEFDDDVKATFGQVLMIADVVDEEELAERTVERAVRKLVEDGLLHVTGESAPPLGGKPSPIVQLGPAPEEESCGRRRPNVMGRRRAIGPRRSWCG